jgi:hypothetical protein
MSRKFIGRKEIAFVNSINKELIQRVIGQEIFYYAILADKTNANDLYNEAVVKIWSPPVKCNCLVMYENTQEQIGVMAPDSKFSVDVYFHTEELNDRNVLPKMGDFIQFGEVVYEIHQVTKPQIIWGLIEQKIMTKCNCGPARKGQFDPVKQPMPETHHDLAAPNYPEQPGTRATTADPRHKQ